MQTPATPVKLVRPHRGVLTSYASALVAYHHEARFLYHDPVDILAAGDDFITELQKDLGHPNQPHQDWVEPVPETILWLTQGDDYLGTAELRHRLNWHLERWGGHLNVTIRPERRGQGMGRIMITQAWRELAQRGITRAVMTVSLKNDAAAHLLESMGAVLHDIRAGDMRFPPRRIYHADLGAIASELDADGKSAIRTHDQT